MEGLLIMIGVFVLNLVIKKLAAKKDNLNVPKPPVENYEDQAEPKPNRSLEELIRQFEESQRQAAQGNIEPATLDSNEDDSDEDDDWNPVVTPKNPGHFTFEEIAESVIQWCDVSVEMLQDSFGISEADAVKVLADLQALQIVGPDMGDGLPDVIVHEKTELDILFRKYEQERQARILQEQRNEAELERQRELAMLANTARTEESPNELQDSPTETPKVPIRKNKNEIRKGFIWAKVLDEPRFKRRWNPYLR